MNKEKVLITGTNSGFGLLATLELAKNGYFVIATMRDLNKKNLLIEKAKESNVLDCIKILQMDVTNQTDVEKVKNEVLNQFGSIDILVNNAGYCLGGIAEDISIEEWKEQFETNVFGVISVTKAFLPSMRNRRKGKIINIGSISGRFGFPAMGPYTSSKFAIEGFSESLRLELLPFNIKVSIIEPGAYKTKIWDKGLENVNVSNTVEYESHLKSIYKEANKSSENAANPIDVAKLILKICSDKNPKLRYPIGKGMKSLIFLKNILSWSVIEWVVKKKIT